MLKCCINFGGCYGYDLTKVFDEYIMLKKSNKYDVNTFTKEYIEYLQQNYDPSIIYQPKENKKLMYLLLKHHKGFRIKNDTIFRVKN